ncbi:hypothetical protein [Paracoccus sp. ME4]
MPQVLIVENAKGEEVAQIATTRPEWSMDQYGRNREPSNLTYRIG